MLEFLDASEISAFWSVYAWIGKFHIIIDGCLVTLLVCLLCLDVSVLVVSFRRMEIR
jgi:hypothetical protein